ncbi:MAG: hypothetical protein AAF773_00030 [Cyanobacteria bacterium P01_D01_bin.115]
MFLTQKATYATFSGRVNEAHEAYLDAAYALGKADALAGRKRCAALNGERLWGTAKTLYYSAYRNAVAA